MKECFYWFFTESYKKIPSFLERIFKSKWLKGMYNYFEMFKGIKSFL